MATITTDTYLDSGTARTAGEAWTVNSGAIFTIRTDTRWHVGSPASMTGSLGSQTINEGGIVYNATAVKWIPFNSGSGTVPAIGTTVTGNTSGASGYLLGVWADLTSAPTAVSAAMPASGFLKFREVTSGPFNSAESLTGISASTNGAQTAGWIEIVADASTTITVGRLGSHSSSGDWFYLDNTNGSIAQVIQIPTNGGGTNTYCPGVWIETSPGSGIYEYWPALNGATNGWARQHLGAAYGATDARQNFVKDIGSGQIQIGEASDLSGTYINIASQDGTYATLAHSCTYTWAGDIVTVYYSTGHLLKTGQTVGLDFTSGGATSYDGNYVITVIDAYYYTVALAGSGTAGNVTVRPGVTVTFASHGLGVGDTVYCNFTSGTGVAGNYPIYAVTGTNTYLIEYPHTTALTAGNVSVHSRYTITYTSHGLAIGNRVYLDFTSGAGIDGIYTIIAVPDANTFQIVANNGTSGDTGNVTIKQTIGNIPASGCKVRIPNIFLRECATGTRASNQVNGTIANRPEWATTTAGAINLTYLYSTWYMNFAQPYSVTLTSCATYDTLICTECATAVDIDNVNVSMYGALDTYSLSFQSNFAGGTVQNCKFQRGNTPGSNDHCCYIAYCNDTVFTNVIGGIIQFARSTGKAFSVNYCDGLTFNNCYKLNSDFPITQSFNITVNDLDHCDRYIGYTNATTPYYGVLVGAGCSNILVDGLTFGLGGTISNVHPYSGLFSYTAAINCRFRNVGTYASPLNAGTWRPNLYACAVSHVTGGNNNTIKLQRIYLNAGHNTRSGGFATVNSDKNILYESIFNGIYVMSAMAVFAQIDAGLNSVIKSGNAGINTTTGQSSVYGTHFRDLFLGSAQGRFILAMNEPTTETTSQFTMVSGTAKFNSAGGILMGVVGNQAIWEDCCFRKGHTGFQNTALVMSGGTASNYTIEYQIDTGSGYGGSWKTANGTNLSGESLDPAVGFKIKIRITTTTTNTTAITYLRFNTNTSTAGQASALYSLDTCTVKVTARDAAVTSTLISDARVYIAASAGGPLSEGTVILNTLTDANGVAQDTAFSFAGNQPVTGRIRRGTSSTFYKTSPITGTITEDGLDITVYLVKDE